MPMHDAALYIVDNLDKACKDDIEKQFKMAFKHYLPNITPIVKFKNYFEGEQGLETIMIYIEGYFVSGVFAVIMLKASYPDALLS